MPRSRLSPMAVGGLIALVLVAAAAGYVAWRTNTLGRTAALPTEGGVLVAVALPDLGNVMTVRAIEAYASGASGPVTQSVDPSSSVVVPGTSAARLGQAYLYGGGAALARGYATEARTVQPSWIVIDGPALRTLLGDRPVTLVLPAPLEVFDGDRLSSYPAGAVVVSGDELGRVMEGVDYLPDAQRRDVQAQLSRIALTALVRYSAPLDAVVKTNLKAPQLEEWLLGVDKLDESTATP